LKSTGPPTEEALISRAREGDEHAFRQLVLRHQQQVRATVLGMLGDIPEADDVAQEVFVKLHENLHEFRGDSKLSTYLVRIAINLSLNEQKKRQRQQRRLKALDSEQPPPQIEDINANPERFETRDLLQQALGQLDPEFRAVVVLRLIDGYSVKETAEILNVPQGTVASRLARAQVRLRGLLEAIRQ
jgi:RNA polymerase sigma-70 factor (ECF subfamily)